MDSSATEIQDKVQLSTRISADIDRRFRAAYVRSRGDLADAVETAMEIRLAAERKEQKSASSGTNSREREAIEGLLAMMRDTSPVAQMGAQAALSAIEMYRRATTTLSIRKTGT